MARVARACGFGIGDLRFRGLPRSVPHSTDPANPAKSHEPPNRPILPDLPNTHKLPDRLPGRGGAKHPFETKTRVPRRRAALSRQKSAHRTTLRFARDCPDIALKPSGPWPPRSGRFRRAPTPAKAKAARAAKPLFAAPAILSQGLPRPADPALREPRCASTFLNMS